MKRPVFRFGERVQFIADKAEHSGRICIVDGGGPKQEPQYDIFVSNHPLYPFGVLFKHIQESRIRPHSA